MPPPIQTPRSRVVEEEMLTQKPCSEIGAGGGGGDLNQVHEHELELEDATAVQDLIESCKKEIEDQETRSKTIDLILTAKKTQKTAILLGDLGLLNMNRQTIPLADLPKLLAKLIGGDGEVGHIDERLETSSRSAITGRTKTLETSLVRQELPRSIVSTFKTPNLLQGDLLA